MRGGAQAGTKLSATIWKFATFFAQFPTAGSKAGHR